MKESFGFRRRLFAGEFFFGRFLLRFTQGRGAGARLDALAALGDHVAIAAGIFDPAAVAFAHQHACRDAVEKIAVVADDDQRAGIIREHFFEQVERFEVEIIRRLVENEQIRRLRQRARQQQTAAFAARKLADRRSRLFGLEQEIFHIADDMTPLAVDLDHVGAAARQRVLRALSRDEGSRGSAPASPFRDWRRGESCRDLARARRSRD